MIQRKQTLYLLLAAAILISVPFLPLGHTDSGNPFTALGGIPGAPVAYGITLFIAAIVAVVDVFFWRNRPLQMRIATLDLLLVILSYGVFFFSHNHIVPSIHYTVQLANFLPLFAIFSLALAIRGIRRDEKLIKSLDRIR